MSTIDHDAERRRELTRRIEDLESRDPDDFGHFGALDWAICVVGALVLPVLAFLWFAP